MKKEEFEIGKRILDDVLARGDIPTCIVCDHFNQMSELCSLANERPPAHVIVFGCPEFSFIPF